VIAAAATAAKTASATHLDLRLALHASPLSVARPAPMSSVALRAPVTRGLPFRERVRSAPNLRLPPRGRGQRPTREEQPFLVDKRGGSASRSELPAHAERIERAATRRRPMTTSGRFPLQERASFSDSAKPRPVGAFASKPPR
jgi:hypothetical protein